MPPRFRARPKNALAQVNTDVELECDVAGIPRPTITWLKDGDRVINSDYFQIIEGRNLRILGLVDSDAGMYQCFVENVVGSEQASAQLIVTHSGKLWSCKTMPHLVFSHSKQPVHRTLCCEVFGVLVNPVLPKSVNNLSFRPLCSNIPWLKKRHI